MQIRKKKKKRNPHTSVFLMTKLTTENNTGRATKGTLNEDINMYIRKRYIPFDIRVCLGH